MANILISSSGPQGGTHTHDTVSQMITSLACCFPSERNCSLISAQTHHSQAHQHQTRGSQCHSKRHTCAQIKISPLTLLCTDTSKTGSVLPKPSTVLYGSPPELEGNREKVYQVEEGSGRNMCHTGHLQQTGNSALIPPSSPGLLCSLDQDLSSQKDREI